MPPTCTGVPHSETRDRVPTRVVVRAMRTTTKSLHRISLTTVHMRPVSSLHLPPRLPLWPQPPSTTDIQPLQMPPPTTTAPPPRLPHLPQQPFIHHPQTHPFQVQKLLRKRKGRGESFFSLDHQFLAARR